ncbi:MAG: hypothetical protein Q7S03_03135 [bacterium]|nr:hypothetical protein [bacterium]
MIPRTGNTFTTFSSHERGEHIKERSHRWACLSMLMTRLVRESTAGKRKEDFHALCGIAEDTKERFDIRALAIQILAEFLPNREVKELLWEMVESHTLHEQLEAQIEGYLMFQTSGGRS